jgi:hypothetical protein
MRVRERDYFFPVLLIAAISLTLIKTGGRAVNGYQELYFTNESDLKVGKIGPIKGQFFILFFLSIFLFAIMQFSNQKIIRLKKYWGAFTPLSRPPSYANARPPVLSHISIAPPLSSRCASICRK